MKLVNVYLVDSAAVLYDLLQERPEEASISHREMPAWSDHVCFVASRPYEAWYLIEDDGEFVGSIYLSKRDEIGVFVFRRYQRKGYCRRAVALLMQEHRRDRYLANVNPRNEASTGLFESLGFRHIQNTYEIRASEG